MTGVQGLTPAAFDQGRRRITEAANDYERLLTVRNALSALSHTWLTGAGSAYEVAVARDYATLSIEAATAIQTLLASPDAYKQRPTRTPLWAVHS